MNNDIPEPWTEVVTRADRGCVTGEKFPISNPQWQEVVSRCEYLSSPLSTQPQNEEELATEMQDAMNAAGFGETPIKPRRRHIPGAKTRLDARYDDIEPPLDAPATDADKEGLERFLKQHPSVTGQGSAGR